MTRQEHLDHGLIVFNGYMMNGWQYKAYYKVCQGMGCDGPLKTWEEIQIEAKPWLADDESFATKAPWVGRPDPTL